MEDVKRIMFLIKEEYYKIVIRENPSNARDFLEEIQEELRYFILEAQQ